MEKRKATANQGTLIWAMIRDCFISAIDLPPDRDAYKLTFKRASQIIGRYGKIYKVAKLLEWGEIKTVGEGCNNNNLNDIYHLARIKEKVRKINSWLSQFDVGEEVWLNDCGKKVKVKITRIEEQTLKKHKGNFISVLLTTGKRRAIGNMNRIEKII